MHFVEAGRFAVLSFTFAIVRPNHLLPKSIKKHFRKQGCTVSTRNEWVALFSGDKPSLMMPSQHLIRRATIDDVPSLHKLDHVACDCNERRELIQNAVIGDRAWVIQRATTPLTPLAGYGIISHGSFFGRSFVDLVYIEETKRSCGYGPALLAFFEGESQSDDLFTSTNESNRHMQHLLEQKLGYERSGIIHNLDPGDPEIVYIKRSVRRAALAVEKTAEGEPR